MLSLQDLHRRRQLEHLAEAFGNRLPHTAPPVDVEALAGIAGIVDITYSDRISGSALLIGSPISGLHGIVLKRTESKVRQRFSIAHEIAHRIIHPNQSAHHYREMVAARGGRNRIERECDYFAACVLMPRTLLNAWAPGSNCSETARAFGVSREAMKHRLEELGLYQVALQR